MYLKLFKLHIKNNAFKNKIEMLKYLYKLKINIG